MAVSGWSTRRRLRGIRHFFPLLLFKRISDVWDEECQAVLADSDGAPSYAEFAENHRFQIPQGAHWNDVRQVPKNVEHGHRS